MEPNQEHEIREWIKETIKKFQDAEDHAQVYFSGALFNSFIDNIIKSSDGNISQIEIKFKYYLRFLDMGVGRGVPLGSHAKEKAIFEKNRKDNGQLFKYKRKGNTRLYSKIKTNRVKSLAEMLAKNFAIESVGLIETNLNDFNYEI